MTLPAFQLNHMLKQQGQTSTLTKVTTDNYNPLTGTVNTTTEVYTIKAYFATFTLADSDKVVSGSRSVLVGRYDIDGTVLPEIVPNDTLELLASNVAIVAPDGSFWTDTSGNVLTGPYGIRDTVNVKSVQKIYSGDSVTCYICEAVE